LARVADRLIAAPTRNKTVTACRIDRQPVRVRIWWSSVAAMQQA